MNLDAIQKQSQPGYHVPYNSGRFPKSARGQDSMAPGRSHRLGLAEKDTDHPHSRSFHPEQFLIISTSLPMSDAKIFVVMFFLFLYVENSFKASNKS